MKRSLRFMFWPAAKKRLFMKVLIYVAGIRLGLWLVPFRRLMDWLDRVDPDQKGHRVDWTSVQEIASLVASCSRRVPEASCLTQALATKCLLNGIGQSSTLRIGVAKGGGDVFIAHAWVEVGDEIVVGNRRDIARYSVMSNKSGSLA